MLRLSKLTDYAVVVLVRLSGMDGVQTSPGLAEPRGHSGTDCCQGAEGPGGG